jgi:hypothetical protein
MIRPAWHDRAVRDLGRRLLIGLAVVAAGATALGYAFIAGGIAAPVRGDRAVLDVPASGAAQATLLDDGQPVFVVNDPDRGIWVIDAQGRQRAGELPVLVAWCPTTRMFADPAAGSAYAPDGELRWGPADGGLIAYATRAAPDDPSRVIVGSDTTVQGHGPATDGPPETTCSGASWLVHEPTPGEVFDPSVAVTEEAPGWIWLEGSLEATGDGGVRLCDGGDGDCTTWAEVVGIDPASVGSGSSGPAGLFIGRVRDDAIEALILVPDLEESP